ncbi:MAG TPA: nucleotidyltransferase family protein [Puia sp.]|nr:nucleotidyltransferase family protein [Puia sp.]
MSKTGIIILAAGNSSRMGEPKQLMMYNNKTFLQHIIAESKNALLDPVICVTGYESDLISESISGMEVSIVYNEYWSEGMGSGISAGIKQLLLSDVDSVILTVSDQPYVTSDLFGTMLKMKVRSGKRIVACSYAGTLGTPVLFSKEYFNQLKSLSGNQGAKNIVKLNLPDVCSVEFEKGEIDIDTKEDYKNLISENDTL